MPNRRSRTAGAQRVRSSDWLDGRPRTLRIHGPRIYTKAEGRNLQEPADTHLKQCRVPGDRELKTRNEPHEATLLHCDLTVYSDFFEAHARALVLKKVDSSVDSKLEETPETA